MEEPLWQAVGFASLDSMLVTVAVIHVLDAVVCVLIAVNRDRDPKLWAALGLVGGLLALTAILLLPPPKQARAAIWRRPPAEGGEGG